MATPSGRLATAVAAKDADAAALAFADLDGQPLDARMLSGACNLFARTRKNQQAWDAFSRGRETHGVPKLISAGLSLNALLYACCREPAMGDHAMGLWSLMAESGVAPEQEPAEKLLLSALSRHKYDDAFGVFLGAIDAGLQPSAPACTALVRTSAVVPRLAQSAYAVQLTMKSAGMELASEVLASLLRACIAAGTVEQCLALHADLDGRGEHSDVARTSKMIVKMAESSSALASKGAEMLRELKAKADEAGVAGAAGGAAAGSAKAYEAVLLALGRAALSRTNPATCQAAHTVLNEMLAVGHQPPRAPLTTLLTACCRTGQRRQALDTFRALMAAGGAGGATAPVDPTLVKALLLALGKSPGATSWHEVGADDVQLLLSAMSDAVEVDKEVASSLVRLTAACGMLLEARKRLVAMCAARDPPMPPGAALLAYFISACGKHASGPEEGCRAFAELSKEGPLSLSKHVDIWMGLMQSCCAQKRGASRARRPRMHAYPCTACACAHARSLPLQGLPLHSLPLHS